MTEEKHINRDDDATLVTLCKKGDMHAFETLVRKHQKKVFNMAYRMVGHYEEASDITQEAFIAVYKGINKFEEKAKFSTWLYTIAINTSKNRLRQLKSRQAREQASIDDPIRTGNGEITIEPRSNEPTILERLETKEVQARVQACIDSLEEEFKEVIVLRDIQGLTYGEISEVLNVPEGTVKSRLFRGRESLKELLKRVMGEL
jgi:RNA polymerase sigma-70 factor (ECF subfamily)